LNNSHKYKMTSELKIFKITYIPELKLDKVYINCDHNSNQQRHYIKRKRNNNNE